MTSYEAVIINESVGSMRERRKRGFTLAELLVVVVIIGVLVAVSIPIFTAQLEKSRRAVDMANARNIQAVLNAGLTSGDIVFTSETTSDGKNQSTCIAIIVQPDGIKGFVSGNATVYGKSYDNTSGDGRVGHERIEKFIENNGLTNYKTRCHDTKSSDGWNWYGVFLYNDGSMRIASGADSNYDKYQDDTFEALAAWWKTQSFSNIEKAMGK